MPNQSSSQAPSGPCLPSSSSSTKPTTTGGSTRGRCTRPLTTAQPGKRYRASSQATAIPKGRLIRTAQPATRRLSMIASTSSGVSDMASIDDEAGAGECGPALRPGQEGEETHGERRGAARDEGDRVDDRLVQRCRNCCATTWMSGTRMASVA